MSKKELMHWRKRELRPAYRDLKAALKSGDEGRIKNAATWLIATCEPLKGVGR